jgi:hypothetical protein
MLCQQIPGCAGEGHQECIPVLPCGRMPRGEDLIGEMPGNMARIFIFNPTLEPSFKLMHTSTEAVSTISKSGVCGVRLFPPSVSQVCVW